MPSKSKAAKQKARKAREELETSKDSTAENEEFEEDAPDVSTISEHETSVLNTEETSEIPSTPVKDDEKDLEFSTPMTSQKSQQLSKLAFGSSSSSFKESVTTAALVAVVADMKPASGSGGMTTKTVTVAATSSDTTKPRIIAEDVDTESAQSQAETQAQANENVLPASFISSEDDEADMPLWASPKQSKVGSEVDDSAPPASAPAAAIASTPADVASSTATTIASSSSNRSTLPAKQEEKLKATVSSSTTSAASPSASAKVPTTATVPAPTLPPTPWTLYYSEEGYPYYYNSITGESQWAQAEQPHSQPMYYNYSGSAGVANMNAATARSDSDEVSSASDDSSLDSLATSEDESDDSEDDDSSEDDGDDDDEENLAEMGLGSNRKHLHEQASKDRQSKDKNADIMEASAEEQFRLYLESEEGKRDYAKEQLRIERRIEKKFQSKARATARRAASAARVEGSSSRHKKSDDVALSAETDTKQSQKSKKKGNTPAPLEAIRATMGGLFGGLSELAVNVTSKSAILVDNYWKGRGVTTDPKAKPLSSSSSKSSVKRGGDTYSTSAQARSSSKAEVDTEGGEAGESSDDEDDVASEVSSNDSDVQEIEAPLLPEWFKLETFTNKVSSKFNSFLVGYGLEESSENFRRKASDLTATLAHKGLEGAEWVLEITGQGVTMVGSAILVRFNGAVQKLITDISPSEQERAAQLAGIATGGRRNIEEGGSKVQAGDPSPPKGAPPSHPLPDSIELQGDVAPEEIGIDLA